MCFYYLLKCISCAKNLINKLPICIKNTMQVEKQEQVKRFMVEQILIQKINR